MIGSVCWSTEVARSPQDGDKLVLSTVGREGRWGGPGLLGGLLSALTKLQACWCVTETPKCSGLNKEKRMAASQNSPSWCEVCSAEVPGAQTSPAMPPCLPRALLLTLWSRSTTGGSPPGPCPLGACQAHLVKLYDAFGGGMCLCKILRRDDKLA